MRTDFMASWKPSRNMRWSEKEKGWFTITKKLPTIKAVLAERDARIARAKKFQKTELGKYSRKGTFILIGGKWIPVSEQQKGKFKALKSKERAKRKARRKK